MENKENNIIYADPTKAFFLEMLTRDINIQRAIIDLIDNSIDGAKRMRLGADANFKGLWVKMEIKPDKFLIWDNCGGIPLEIAKNYAFCFGRPPKYNEALTETMKHAVGRFGVGMKRALFKMGNDFRIESKNATEHFTIQDNIKKWESKEKWEFQFTDKSSDVLTSDGTLIEVSSIFENISEYFQSPIFMKELIEEIEWTVGRSIDNGLEISINNIKLSSRTVVMYETGEYKPVKYEKTYLVKSKGTSVKVTVFAGIGEESPSHAGWYIYMNDRLVLSKDKTAVTGWKDQSTDDKDLTKYASKHAVFRGVVLFEADRSDVLPMTTTKTGVDTNHPIFKSARQALIMPAMNQVFGLINRMGTVAKVVETFGVRKEVKTTELIVNSNSYTETIVYPIISSKPKEGLVKVTFQKESELMMRVQEYFKTKNANKAAEQAFDKFVKNNELDNDDE